MTETWNFLKSPAADAAMNMAVDEALLRTAAERGRPLLRVYSWLRPAVSIGYFQKFPSHLAGKYEIVRRPTGGGLVYHGDGVDTTYTVVVPPPYALYRMKTADAYCAIHKAVAAACELCSRAPAPRVPDSRPSIAEPRKSFAATRAVQSRAYECFQNQVHGDVVDDGRKLAGGAQRRNKSGMLHQGSIAATVPADGLKQAFCDAFGADFQGYELSQAERALAGKLVQEKYATDAWNRR